MIIIAGPCQYENLDMSLEIAETCRDICEEASIDYIFKASFDKANRTSLSGQRGVGMNNCLEGFEKIIDSFGGIEICVDVTQREGYSFELQKGCQTVMGSTALNWVVSRNTEVLVGEKLVDKDGNDISEWEKMKGVSDLSRNDRQQYIILQLLSEIKDFRSIGSLNNFIGTLEDAFIIDENLSINKAVNILWNFRDTDLSNIKKLSISVNPYELDDGRQVLIMTENFTDYAKSMGLYNS